MSLESELQSGMPNSLRQVFFETCAVCVVEARKAEFKADLKDAFPGCTRIQDSPS